MQLLYYHYKNEIFMINPPPSSLTTSRHDDDDVSFCKYGMVLQHRHLPPLRTQSYSAMPTANDKPAASCFGKCAWPLPWLLGHHPNGWK